MNKWSLSRNRKRKMYKNNEASYTNKTGHHDTVESGVKHHLINQSILNKTKRMRVHEY